MTSLTIPERLARLDRAHAEGKIIRGSWGDGANPASLLFWYSPEARASEDARACPADAMPPWLAHLTVWLDDAPSEAAWPGVIARYVRVLPRLLALAPERLTWLDYECRAIAVREARTHTKDPPALVGIDGVLVLLDRAAIGGAVQRMEWEEAAKAAARAAGVAAKAAAWAAGAAGAEAWAAAWAAWAAVDAAWTEAWAEAWAEAAWTAAAEDASTAASKAAADRMADAMLTAIERAIEEGQEIST